ncbi:EAL domain-containing protein [Longimicrobium terrae]|uniref:Diguanylate cyclase (GGDEF)-like protein/PAS domain S-box-containing protein n=1 Tax=Longimicrobium terrae TaxID=1639882 RepID=A0A841GY40_9BACT|nr:diguanylate cyclase (GGDEF)-like protein/PAS domain S-box-containing protein [Longimicrobium terrae]MBB6070656.1 diguanylate cyclase (GGDEF)-like protein/PAS domain S-box-containing protein [Longimicrobium terrae]NNC29639.1 EAL domain-containing protein [Longimicrobium terrae]
MADSECPDGIPDALFQALAMSETVGVAVCDRDFRYLAWNRFMERMTGLSAPSVLGRNALEIHPHLRDERLEPVLRRVLGGESVCLPDRRYHVPGVRSGWIWVQYVPHRAADGSIAGVIGLVHEVPPRTAEERADVLREMADSAWNGGGRIVSAQLVIPVAEARVGPRELRWSRPVRRPLRRVHPSGEDGAPPRAAGERPRGALHDPLTGLANRRGFMDRLEGELDRARRGDGEFAVLCLDLDRFKILNDSLGHPAGDRLLAAVAGRLRGCAGEAGTVARLGGDEFAVLLPSVSVQAAVRATESIHRALTEPVVLEGYEVFASASIGIAPGPGCAGGAEALMRGADAAMYRAKAAGPGGWAVYEQGMHTRALARLRLETDLRRALDQGRISVHYQPIVHLASGRITGMEALARWRHPERGWVPPAEFIACAEETGLILRLGRHVLDTACAQLGAWSAVLPAAGELSVSVNVSVRQFAQAELADQVKMALERGGVAPGRLRLEITESVLMDAGGDAPAVLGRLRSLGAATWMDDFGTGFSSLSALHRLPMDGVKVDRSFLAEDEARGAPVLAAIAGLARGLGLQTVAEGVETPAQLDRVRALGCDHAQGYLISPALDAEAMLALLAQDRRW